MDNINFDLYARKVCELKREDTIKSHSDVEKVAEVLKDVFHNIYNVICIDIDKTIIQNTTRDIVPKNLINVFEKIFYNGAIVCFITGRGKENAKKAIMQLLNEIIFKINCRRIFCIINNGTELLFCNEIEYINEDFLNNSKSLLDKNNLTNFKSNKQKLRDQMADILSENLKLSKESLIMDSISSSGQTSLRFIINRKINNKKLKTCISKLKKLDSFKNYHLFLGEYKDKRVIELSLFTKGNAVKKISEYLGISEDKILRIGDQGQQYGNDYSMLDSAYGFTVKNYSTNIRRCFPVLNWEKNYELLTGTAATTFLLSNMFIYSTIVLNQSNRSKYFSDLLFTEKKCFLQSKNLRKEYDKKLSKVLVNHIYDVQDFMDYNVGAIFFYDWEYEELYLQNPNHLLFKVFLPIDSNEEIVNLLNYCMNVQNGILLRGPVLYYSGLCFRVNDSFHNRQLTELLDFFNRFVQNVYSELSKQKDQIDLHKYYDRKTIMGIVDNVRNILLLFFNILLQKHLDNKSNIILNINALSVQDKSIRKCYEFIGINTLFYYNLLFNDDVCLENYIEYVQELRDFLNKECRIVFQETSKNKAFDIQSAYRVWREIDNFYENCISLESSLNQFSDLKKINFFAIRYGSIELPIIAQVLINKVFNKKCQFNSFIICLQGKYKDRHGQSSDRFQNVELYPNNVPIERSEFTILSDDNILTGKTMQIALELLIKKHINPDYLLVIRYPTLNRLEQMFSPSNICAPDTTLINKKIIGFISSAPYTKIFKDDYLEGFKDKFSIFNYTRAKVVQYLYANGKYHKNSEVDLSGRKNNESD